MQELQFIVYITIFLIDSARANFQFSIQFKQWISLIKKINCFGENTYFYKIKRGENLFNFR